MPLELQAFLPGGAQLGLWRVVEPEETLRQGVRLSAAEAARILLANHPTHRNLALAARRCALELDPALGELTWDREGRVPLLQPHGPGVSLSHSGAWAAALLHPERNVALDVEDLSIERNPSLAARFMNPAELEAFRNQPSALRLRLVWCAKECLYKLHAARQAPISFRQQLDCLLPEVLLEEDVVEARFFPRSGRPVHHRIGYRVHGTALLAWVLG